MTERPLGPTSRRTKPLAPAHWRPRQGLSSLAAILLAAWCLPASAQDVTGDSSDAPASDSATDTSATGNLATGPRSLPHDAFRTDPAVGVPYRSLFRNTDRPIRTTVDINEGAPEGSESAGTSFRVPFFRGGIRGGAVRDLSILNRGFEPSDADLKVGPLFFKLRALSGAVLATDNANLTHDDRESGAIAIASISGSVVAQITESLRLAASGSIVWLPFKGKVGFVSNSAYYNFGMGAGMGADFQLAELVWDGKIGQWDVTIRDSFNAYFPTDFFSGFGAYGDTLYEGSDFSEFDRIGRYRFGGGGSSGSDYDAEYRSRIDDNGDVSLDDTVYHNHAEILAERLYPGPVRLRLRAYRDDLWYNQGSRGRPTIREGFSAFARAEREDLRFKPYISYSANRNDDEGEFNQLVLTGFSGPITDQLYWNTYAGLYFPAYSSTTHFVAGTSFHHVAGPYTTESLFAGREINDEYSRTEISDRITYTITQILGPDLTGGAFASYVRAQPDDDSDFERREYRLGAYLTCIPGPKTVASLSYRYSRLEASDSSFLYPDTDRDVESTSSTLQTVQFSLSYHFTDTFQARLLYRYQRRDTDVEEESYYENLGLFSLTKYFE